MDVLSRDEKASYISSVALASMLQPGQRTRSFARNAELVNGLDWKFSIACALRLGVGSSWSFGSSAILAERGKGGCARRGKVGNAALRRRGSQPAGHAPASGSEIW